MNQVINFLNMIALSAMRRSELVGAFFVIAIVFMMITPLPTGLVDVLIAVNICISCLLIMLAMHLPRPLAFSTFPAVLLLTTMFRLALSVSTTRLILLNQDAGHIVEAFGQFVVGGNLAVGLVIFLILTVVNFLVITKGSERVAEVGARFTLDAMPGKQMSIDSDLRANLITVHEARKRRAELNKESQLFGAMDGAMKFVNGDAIASLIIVAINMIGGISIGVLQHNMAAGDALQLYTVLTIGDGLIAQIPALLISVTSGMIITRVPNTEAGVEANIGREIAEQITSQPKAWIIASVAMLGFAALPGMPTGVFITIAIICGAGGFLQLQRAKPKADEQRATAVAPEMNGKEDLRTFSPSRQFVLQFHPGQDSNQIQALVSEIRKRRNRLVVQYGLTLPSFIIEHVEDVAPDEFRFNVYDVPMLKATFTQTHVAVDVRQLGGENLPAAIPGNSDRQEDQWVWLPAEQCGDLDSVNAMTLIVERMERALQYCAPQFIGLQETKAILSWLETEQPELAQEIQRVLTLTRFSAVLQRLASESVPLRAIRADRRNPGRALSARARHQRADRLCPHCAQVADLSPVLRRRRPASVVADAGKRRPVARRLASDTDRNVFCTEQRNQSDARAANEHRVPGSRTRAVGAAGRAGPAQPAAHFVERRVLSRSRTVFRGNQQCGQGQGDGTLRP